MQHQQEAEEALSLHNNLTSFDGKTKTQQSEDVRRREREELFMKAHMQTQPSRRR